MAIELVVRDSDKFVEAEVQNRTRWLVLARVSFGVGLERYLAFILHELVATGKLDVRVVKHWFELCEKGDGPKVEKR